MSQARSLSAVRSAPPPISENRLCFLIAIARCTIEEIADLTGWTPATIQAAVSEWKLCDSCKRNRLIRESFYWVLENVRSQEPTPDDTPARAYVHRWLRSLPEGGWPAVWQARRVFKQALRSGDISGEDLDAFASNDAGLIELLGESLLAVYEPTATRKAWAGE